MPEERRSDDARGLLLAVGAYGLWGFLPLYFKAVASVPPPEILAHRIVWSLVIVAVVAGVLGRGPAIREVLRSRRRLGLLVLSSALIAVNWLLFIGAVTGARLLEASLGYFINPVVSVLLGAVVLGERLDRPEWVSLGLAGAAVTWLIVALGVVPVLSLSLAITFGLYGLVRKRTAVGSLEGLAVETALLAPLALAWLAWRSHQGDLVFAHRSRGLDLLLLAAGPATAVPLLCFAGAVRRLRLATVGLMQYISPTMQFLLAVLAFGEPLGRARLVAFALIWAGLGLFALHNWRLATAAR